MATQRVIADIQGQAAKKITAATEVIAEHLKITLPVLERVPERFGEPYRRAQETMQLANLLEAIQLALTGEGGPVVHTAESLEKVRRKADLVVIADDVGVKVVPDSQTMAEMREAILVGIGGGNSSGTPEAAAATGTGGGDEEEDPEAE